MGIREHIEVAIKSVCMAIAHKALSSIDAEYDIEEAPEEPSTDEAAEFYATHATPQAPPANINGAGSEVDADHALWLAEQEMLRRVRPGSPLIDPDFDAMTRDIITPAELL